MLTIIDYNAGNLRSVTNALRRLGCDYRLTRSADELRRADRVLLPGVGHCGEAVHRLRATGLAEVIPTLRRPVLGICVGLQLLCRSSEESAAADGAPVACLGVFDARVRRFERGDAEAKVPHMGWNTIENLEKRLFAGVNEGSHVYYVHSYYATLCSDTIATTRHGGTLFSAALQYENFYATQFHPEKSGDTGEAVLRNFLML